VGIFNLRIYVAVTSPYPRDQGVIGTLKVHGTRGTLGEGILKVSSGSLIVLKGTQRNNLYYLKGGLVTENLTVSKYLKDDST